MDDEPLDERLRDATRGYHQPPETPREEIWARLQAARSTRKSWIHRTGVRPIGQPRRVFWIAGAAAAAAVLAVGVGLGRLSMRGAPEPRPQVAGTAAPQVNATAYRLVTQEHLGQSEAFLTLFRTSVTQGGSERLASATARQLLASNRLLLDSPAAADRKTRLLLEDLELVLAEIAQLSPQSRERDLQLVRDGIDRGNVMSRLRTAVPAGMPANAAPIQGAL